MDFLQWPDSACAIVLASVTDTWWALAIAFFGTLALVPVVVLWLPQDYFVRDPSTAIGPWFSPHRLIRNGIGVLLVVLGLVLLVLPGQGLLTVLAGVVLLDFPGKHQVERKIFARRGVRKVLNWIRTKAGRDLFAEPAPEE
jgi:hypothetical protein